MRFLANTLFVVPGAQSGAVQTVTEALLSHLSGACKSAGEKLYLLASRSGFAHWQQLCPDSDVLIFPASTDNPVKRVALEQAACHWAVQKVGADVFYSSSGALPCAPLPCRSVVFLQNILFFHHGEFYTRKILQIAWPEWILKYRGWELYSRRACLNAMKRASEVIAVSHTMAKEAMHFSGIQRSRPVHVVPCGVHDRFRPLQDLQRPITDPYILSVSSLVPHKNYEACIRIFAHLREKYRVRNLLVLIGSGPPEYVATLKKLAARLNVSEAILFLGHVDHGHLPLWYSHADVFILTSSCESFGLPTLEAMACGTPVVASSRSGLPETVGSGGILEDPDRTEAFANKIYQVLTDRSLRQHLIEEGLSRSAHYNWNKTARAMLDIMRNARVH